MRSAIAPIHSPRSCGACGGTSSSVICRQRFVVPEGYPLPATYSVVCCNACGFIYADAAAAATQEDYNRFYSEWSKYDNAATSTGSGQGTYDAERLRVIASELAQTLPSPNLRILDAGCATGGLLAALRNAGFKAIAGLDPSARCAQVCQELDFETHIGTIAAPPAGMPRFDCMVLSHVLEHVFDIPAFFDSVGRLLLPGGYLYLETPDATRYVDYLYAPFQEFNTEHINHFSRVSLENTASRFGFEPIVVRQKIIQTSKHQRYPAVFGIFRLNQHSSKTLSFKRDQVLPKAIAEYVRQSQTLMQQIDCDLKTQLAGQDRIVLWGAGQLAMKLLDLPSLRVKNVVAVVDSNPVLHGKRLAGAPVIAPSALSDRSAPILIATLLHEDEIASRIHELGVCNRVVRLSAQAEAAESVR